jgi:hypothetical protein
MDLTRDLILPSGVGVIHERKGKILNHGCFRSCPRAQCPVLHELGLPAVSREEALLSISDFLSCSWQDDIHGREVIQWFDPSIVAPPPERGYGEDCSFTAHNLYNALDLFAFAHLVGWFGKALILRDFWVCTILSVMFEVSS